MTNGVYAIANKQTGQTYIGSSGNVKQRLINQRCFLKTGHPCVIAAFKNQKVNIDNFDFRVLIETPTVQEAKEIETALLECFWGNNLYNKSAHSNGSTGVKRDPVIYAAGAKKQWADPEAKQKRMLAMRGKRKIVQCPHCEKTGGGGNMHRYHFENCKAK